MINVDNKKFWNKLLKNVLIIFSGDTGAAVINVISLVLTIRIIGDTNYGILAVAQSFVLIITTFFSFQSWQSIIKFGVKHLIKKDYIKFTSLVKLTFIVDVITAVVAFIIGITIIPIIAKIMGWDQQLITVIYIYIFSILFNVTGTPTGILRVLDQFKYVAIHKIAIALIRFIILLGCLLTNINDLLSIVIVYTLTEIIGYISLTIIALVKLMNVTSLKKLIKIPLQKEKKDYFKFTIFTNLSSSIDVPVKQFDVMIISLLSVELVAVYKVYKQIVDILGKLVTPISQSIMPQFSELIASGNVTESVKIMKKIRNLILCFMFPIVIVGSFFTEDLLLLIFGELYADYYVILLIYMSVKVISLSYVAIHPLFVSLGLVKQNFYIALITNVLYVVIAFTLIDKIDMLAIIIAYLIQFSLVIIMKNIYIDRYIKHNSLG